ncbi:hypothetical protein [Kitasatospora sp. NPDC088346]|uniref:hypothetical protein n=1 Tax=Kitasatospora sp. NPDC088346 TaxID=3364073 RepID=UPI00382E6271
MRRLALTAAALAGPCLLTLAAPGPADAATGTLTLNGRTVTDPGGCYRDLTAPLTLQNHTGATAYIYPTADCTGPSHPAPAGQSVSSTTGHSVRI